MNRNSRISKKAKRIANTSAAVGMAVLMGVTPVISAVPVYADDSSDEDKVDKEESVYVNADASGKTSKITVSDHLYNPDGASTLEDSSTLSDIENVKGDETYTGSGSNMTWSANGSDIYYQGTSTESLPVGVKFTYYLDGKEISAKDLAGKSGKLTIKINYTNNTSVNAKVGGKDTSLSTPFVMMTGLILPDDTFTNVTVDNGKIVNDGSRNVVLAYGMPGLADSLDLENLKQNSKDAIDSLKDAKDTADDLESEDTDDKDETKSDSADTDDKEDTKSDSADTDDKEDTKSDSADTDDKKDTTSDSADSADEEEKADEAKEDIDDFSIPDSVEITADVTNFSLGSTYTFASSDLLDSIDTDNLEDLSDVKDMIDKLEDSMTQLADGCAELNDGAAELDDSYGELDDGIASLKDGLDQVVAGAQKYTSGVDSAAAGADKLSAGASQLDSGAQELADGSSSLSKYADMLSDGVDQTVSGVNDSTEQLSSSLQELDDGLSQLYAALPDQSAALKAMNDAEAVASNNSPSQLVTSLTDLKTTSTNLQKDIDIQNGLLTDAETALKVMDASDLRYDLLSQEVEAFKSTVADLKAQKTTVDNSIAMIQNQEKKDEEAKQVNGELTEQVKATYEYAQRLQTVRSGVKTIKDSVESQEDQFSQAALDQSGKLIQLQTLADGVASGASQISSGASGVANGASTLSTGAFQLDSGLQLLSGNSSTLVSGLKQLLDGSGTLKDGSSQVKDGISQLHDGTQELADSTAKLNSSDMQDIYDSSKDLVDDVSDLQDRLTALNSDDTSYTNYSGIASGKKGSVKFIIATDEIKSSDDSE